MTSDIKLDGLNYREWAASIRMQLRSIGMASHLTDELPDNSKDDGKKFSDWQRTDNRVMGFL